MRNFQKFCIAALQNQNPKSELLHNNIKNCLSCQNLKFRFLKNSMSKKTKTSFTTSLSELKFTFDQNLDFALGASAAEVICKLQTSRATGALAAPFNPAFFHETFPAQVPQAESPVAPLPLPVSPVAPGPIPIHHSSSRLSCRKPWRTKFSGIARSGIYKYRF